jgi:hypothetical protein
MSLRNKPYYGNGRSRHRPKRNGRPPADFRLADCDLLELAAAAHANVVEGRMDGALALSFVVWPDGVPPNILAIIDEAVRRRRETSET